MLNMVPALWTCQMGEKKLPYLNFDWTDFGEVLVNLEVLEDAESTELERYLVHLKYVNLYNVVYDEVGQ